MEKPELAALLEDIKRTRILVIGDFCLDAYWILDPSRSEISLETGLRTRAVREQRYSPGGAGNVASNLVSLGCAGVEAFGLTGPDLFGEKMKRLLSDMCVNTENLLVQPENWDTHVYAKPCEAGMEQNRIDFGNFNSLDQEIEARLLEQANRRTSYADLVVINQQIVSGIHTPSFRRGIAGIIKKHPDKIFIVNSRHFSADYHGAWRKINELEACVLTGIQPGADGVISDSLLKNSILKLSADWQRPVVVTRGSRGSLVCENGILTEIPGKPVRSAIDTVGAGDSSVAGLSAALAAGKDITTAARFGNLVASVTISKILRTGTASPGEILDSI
jgi:rfaE bifunctional protein kinase chain/domain